MTGIPIMQGSREESFREHEHIFSGFMRAYPSSLEVPCPGSIESETFANRIRKIAKELIFYRWATSFSVDEFRLAWKSTAVRVTMARTVVLGPKGGKLEKATPVQRAGQALLTVKNLGPDPRQTLMELVRLHHIGAIEGGFTHIQGLPEGMGEELAERLALQPWDQKEWNVDFRRHPSEPGFILN